MQLLEYQAKELLRQIGVQVPKSILTAADATPKDAFFPVVVKSQVPVGGRGKLGGIRLVKNGLELKKAAKEIGNLEIKGYKPEHLLFEEALEIKRELYLALSMNRDERRVEWVVSKNGGVEVETHHDDVTVLPFNTPHCTEHIARIFGMTTKDTAPLVNGLVHCFFDNDLLLLEVNPLAVTADGKLVCADAKVLVDDNAQFRHEDFDWPESENIKPLGGTIGVIANGAGMAMSTMDTIFAAGAKPANFLDIGGGTGEDVFVKNLSEINVLAGVTSIIVNIFAGITRCDDIARGIIAAKRQIPNLVPLFIRLEGTNKDEAALLLDKAGILLQPDLKTCIELALRQDSSERLDNGNKRVTLGGAAPTLATPVEEQRGADQVAGPASSELRSEAYDASEHIFTNQPTIVQGVTGHHGAFHTEQMLKAGTNIVAGVTPGKGGEQVHGIPVYSTVNEAVEAHGATASVIFVPARFAKGAMLEAIDAGIEIIVCITEGIPVHDMLLVHQIAASHNVTIIGPNCPGFIVPGSHKLGIIASHITKPGHTTIISRSGTLTYELADALTKKGIGQRLILGIGGDPVQGMTFVEALEIAENDPETTQIVLVGEIGGEGETHAADFIAGNVSKPVFGLVVGHSLPAGQTFGHAGAVVGSRGESASEKTAYMASRGITMSVTLDELIETIHEN